MGMIMVFLEIVNFKILKSIDLIMESLNIQEENREQYV